MDFKPARFAALRAGLAQGETPVPASSDYQPPSTDKLMSKLKAEIAAFDASRNPQKIDVATPTPQKSLAEKAAEITAQQEAEGLEAFDASAAAFRPTAPVAPVERKEISAEQARANIRARLQAAKLKGN